MAQAWEEVPAALGKLDDLAAATTDAGRRECEAGCASCCHYPVGVTFPEAIALVRWLWKQPELAAAVDVAWKTGAAWSWEERASRRPRCALLGVGDRCMAYPVRPAACRGFGSTSRSACEASLEAGDDVTTAPPIPVDAEAYWAALGAGEALTRWSEGEGFPSGHVELHEALVALLRASDESVASQARAFRRARFVPAD